MANLRDGSHLTLPHFLKSNYDGPQGDHWPHRSRACCVFHLPVFDLALIFAALWRREKLHPEEFGDGGGAVEVAGEAMLEAVARRRELLAESVHLVLC